MRLILALLCLAAPALAQPSYVDVTGVAEGDTLNVRAGPSADSDDIGDLPRTTRNVEIGAVDESGKWGRIIWEEGNGWIALRFTRPAEQPRIAGTALPHGLSCGGTEPFWNLFFTPAGATYSTPDSPAAPLGYSRTFVADGFGGAPAALVVGAQNRLVIATIRAGACTDGMSDRTYPWSVDALHQSPERQFLQSGCCHLPTDAGQN